MEKSLFLLPRLIVEQFAHLLISAFVRSLFSNAPVLPIALSAFELRYCQSAVSLPVIVCLIDYLLFAEQTIAILLVPSFVAPPIIELEVKKSPGLFLSTNYLPPMLYL